MCFFLKICLVCQLQVLHVDTALRISGIPCPHFRFVLLYGANVDKTSIKNNVLKLIIRLSILGRFVLQKSC